MLAETQRREMLSAMGVDVYVLRGATNRATSEPVRDWLVVATTDAAMKSIQCTQLRKALPHLLRRPDDDVRWITADDASDFESIPPAQAYLVLGAALARTFGAKLPAKQQNAATIAVADEPALSFANAMSKRALWQALKPIARRAREAN